MLRDVSRTREEQQRHFHARSPLVVGKLTCDRLCGAVSNRLKCENPLTSFNLVDRFGTSSGHQALCLGRGSRLASCP